MLKNKIIDYIIIVIGAALYALSVVIFTAPNKIAPGGLTGIATLINYLFSYPIGTFILLMNVPLLFIGFKKIGGEYIVKTITATILVSVLIDIFTLFVPAYRGNMILVCLFGGIFNGTGIALIFSRGGSSGGTDIVASLINRRFPQFSIGYLIMISDAVIVIISAFVYNSIEAGLYAVISIFVSSKLIDRIIYGMSADNGKLMLIITEKHNEVLSALLSGVPRGITVLNAYGAYSGNDKKLLVCAVRPNQVFKVKNIVKSRDSSVFIVVTTASAIYGEGFKNHY